MELTTAIVAAVLAYFVLMKLLFEDFSEFRAKLYSTILFFPVSAALDTVPKKVSLRIWLWLVGGLAVGILTFQFL